MGDRLQLQMDEYIRNLPPERRDFMEYAYNLIEREYRPALERLLRRRYQNNMPQNILRRRIRRRRRPVGANEHDDTSSEEEAERQAGPRQVAPVAPARQQNQPARPQNQPARRQNQPAPAQRRIVLASPERERLQREVHNFILRLITSFHATRVEDAPSSQPYHLPARADRLLTAMRTREWNRNFRSITYQGNRIDIERISTIYSGVLSRKVVSAYMEMIVDRNIREGLPAVYAADPDFAYCVVTDGAKQAGSVHGRCTQLDKKILFFPFLKRGYWSLTVVDTEQKTIDNYNVRREEHPDHLVNIAEYIFRSLLPGNPMMHQWQLRYRKDFPSYRTSVSGLLVLQIAEWISRGQNLEEPSFSFLRKKIILELSERQFFLN